MNQRFARALDQAFVALQYILPHHWLSRLVAMAAESRQPWLKSRLIAWAVRVYGIDLGEAADPDPRAYPSFNAFFTRALKADARPLPEDAAQLASPADGTVSQLGQIDVGRIFQAKGHSYSLLELMGGDAELARPFVNGHFATIYLAPRDYHRVHMPCAGTLSNMTYVPGRLFSVNSVTAAAVPKLFARNERAVCVFDTDVGPVAVILVGAMLVAGIETVWAGQVTPQARQVQTIRYREIPATTLARGAEMGHFRFGSTVILLLPKGGVDWRSDLGHGSRVRMGQALGVQKTVNNIDEK